MLKVGIVGCGFIGGQICRALERGDIDMELYALCDATEEKALKLSSALKTCTPSCMELEKLVKAVDLVVECASQKAVKSVLPAALKAGCDVMVLSVGAFAAPDLRTEIFELARQQNCKIYFPSGAVVGIDGLNSASAAEIFRVSLTTRKPPAGLFGAPFVLEQGIELEKLEEETLIFKGSASEAVRAFPANVNVAATLSLAGIGFERTEVQVIADPKLSRNVHEITVEGVFGKFTTRVENLPSPENPRTSYLAALSAVSTLKKLASPIKIGT
ncbi:MAG: aspartate dehydrogenase [Methanosarcinaceae archaeon]|nr:aspartate dehydrogenase [Methanosarcinaceae archaeon]